MNKKGRMWLRILGIKCCLSCSRFDSKLIKCRASWSDETEIKKGMETPLRDCFEWIKKYEGYEETYVGSGCPKWE